MFKKVLIAEDLDSVNKAVQDLLKNIGVEQIENSQHCDDAYLLLKKAELDNEPFELLICDLSFKPDHRDEKIKSGEELAARLKQELPALKIIINTVEDHAGMVKRIWEAGIADSYVLKDRNGLKNLQLAIEKLAHDEKYLSPSLQKILRQQNLVQLSDYEVSILNYLAEGYNQDEIHEAFREKNISPNSKSSIEKKLKDLRDDFGAKTNPHLISIAKNLQII